MKIERDREEEEREVNLTDLITVECTCVFRKQLSTCHFKTLLLNCLH